MLYLAAVMSCAKICTDQMAYNQQQYKSSTVAELWYNKAATGLVILPKLDPYRWFFCPCDLEIWWTRSKNNREPLPYPKKLCVSFHSNPWNGIQVTNRKCSNQSQIISFSVRMTLKFDGWPWKTIGYLFYATSSCVHHFMAIGRFKLELHSRNAQIGVKFVLTCYLDLWPLTFCMDLTPANGNYSWKFYYDTMTGEKGVTDRWTDRQMDRQNRS